MALGDGIDIFGIDDKQPTDPWQAHRAQQARLGVVPEEAVPQEVPVPGVDVDSMGRAWADVPQVNTAGEVTKLRRELAPGEVKERRAAAIAKMAAEEGVDLDAPPRDAREAARQKVLRDANTVMLGMGAPEVAAGLAVQGGQVYDDAFARAGEMVRKPSRPNPQKPIVTEGATAAQEAIGEQRVAREAVGEATISQEQAIAEELARQGLRNEVELAVMQDRERMAAERQDQIFTQIQEADQRVQKASAELASKPDVDPGRYWASRTNGQKARWIITAILGGLGGVDMTAAYADAVQRDIDAQKSNIDKTRGELDAAVAEHDVARKTMSDFIAVTGDRRAAEAMYEESRWQAAKADLAAEAAEFGVPLTAANVAQAMAEFDEKIAEAKMRWQALVATTPARIGGGVKSAYTPLQQKMLMKRAEAGLEGQQKFAEQAIGIAGDLEKERIKAGPPGEKSLEERKHDDAMLSDLSKQLAPVETYLNLGQNLLDDYERTGDIPGFGNWTPWGIGQGHEMTEEARNFRQAADLFRETAVTDLTGANSSPAQQAAADALKRAQSEDEVAAAIKLVMQMGAEKKQALLRGKQPHIQEAYMQGRAPAQGPNTIGAAGRVDQSAVVTED